MLRRRHLFFKVIWTGVKFRHPQFSSISLSVPNALSLAPAIIFQMKRLSFFDLFPPPNFLNMPAVGLSIEGDVIRAVSFDKKHGHTNLKFADELKLESGSVVGGEILKPDKLSQAIKTLKSEHGVRSVCLALPEEKAYVYETVIPVPDGGEFSEAVEFSIDQNIPLSPSDVVFDFSVIDGPFIFNEVESVRVMVTAYPRAIAEMWVDLLKQANITPRAFIQESQTIARSVVAEGEKKTVLIVHFFKEKTVIAIVSGGFVRFTTTVSSVAENAGKILDSHEGEKISESVELLAVRDEVKKVCSYWQGRTDDKARKDSGQIKSIIVTGHVAHMTDVAEYLAQRAGIPAQLGNVWVNAFSLDHKIPKIDFEESLRYAAAIGAGLQ